MSACFESIIRASRTVSLSAGCDVRGINFAWFHPPLNKDVRLGDEKLPLPILVLQATMQYVRRLVRGLWRRRDLISLPTVAGDGVAVFLTRNQYASLEPIISARSNVTCISFSDDLPGNRFPMTLALIAGLLFVLPAAALILRLPPRHPDRRLMASNFDGIVATYGVYFVLSWLLVHANPKWLLVSNDHLMTTRAAQQAAKSLGIPTVYVPHASVLNWYPTLDFDYALLYGIDSAHKYDRSGGNADIRVYLVGNPKADAVLTGRQHRRSVSSKLSIGVCVNEMDPVSRVVQFVADLSRLGNDVSIALRPHPRDHRDWASALPKIPLSNAAQETALDFLQRVDVVIAGLSNIHLEAALRGCTAIFVDFPLSGHEPHDTFVSDGICIRASDVGSALDIAMNRAGLPESTAGIQRHIDTLDTPYAGRSTELVLSILRAIEEGTEPEEPWHELPGFRHVEVWSLRTAGD